MTRKTYVAVIGKDERDHWLGRVEGLPEVDARGRSLASVHQHILKAITKATGVRPPPGTVTHRYPNPYWQHIIAANRARRKLSEARRMTDEALATIGAAARGLSALGLSVRDIAELLEVSHQRIQQIVGTAPRRRT